MADSMPAENGGQDLGISGWFRSEAFFLGAEVEALVHPRGSAGTIDLQRSEKGKGFSGAGLEPGKVIGNKKSRRVGEIGDAVGVADQETGKLGHSQEDLRRAPARKPARRKASSTIGIRRSKPNR